MKIKLTIVSFYPEKLKKKGYFFHKPTIKINCGRVFYNDEYGTFEHCEWGPSRFPAVIMRSYTVNYYVWTLYNQQFAWVNVS